MVVRALERVLEGFSERVQLVGLQLEFPLKLIHDGHTVFGAVCDDYVYDIHLCVDVIALRQLLE